ncbi:hypothetical protein LCGC14_2454160, partial [marine sediment metagenome]
QLVGQQDYESTDEALDPEAGHVVLLRRVQ